MPPTPSRTISLLRSPTADGVGVFKITLGNQSQCYTFAEIRCDIGGRGFVVHRLGLGTAYHVRAGAPDDCSCECLGWLRHGRCKHVLGLKAIMRQGLL